MGWIWTFNPHILQNELPPHQISHIALNIKDSTFIWLIAWCNIIIICKLKTLIDETFCRNGVSGAQETLELSRGLGGGRGGVEVSGGPGQGPPSGHLPNMRHNGKLHNYRTSSVDYCPGLCLPSFLEDNLNIMNLKVLLRSMGWPGGVSL